MALDQSHNRRRSHIKDLRRQRIGRTDSPQNPPISHTVLQVSKHVPRPVSPGITRPLPTSIAPTARVGDTRWDPIPLAASDGLVLLPFVEKPGPERPRAYNTSAFVNLQNLTIDGLRFSELERPREALWPLLVRTRSVVLDHPNGPPMRASSNSSQSRAASRSNAIEPWPSRLIKYPTLHALPPGGHREANSAASWGGVVGGYHRRVRRDLFRFHGPMRRYMDADVASPPRQPASAV